MYPSLGPEESAGKVVAGHVRDEPLEPVTIEDAAVGHAEPVLDLDAALERHQVGFAMTEAEVAVARDLEEARPLEGREGAHAVHADRDGELVEVLGLDDPDRQTGRSARDPAALDDGDVGSAALGQVVGRRQAEGAGSDDDDRWAGGHGILPAGATPRSRPEEAHHDEEAGEQGDQPEAAVGRVGARVRDELQPDPEDDRPADEQQREEELRRSGW